MKSTASTATVRLPAARGVAALAPLQRRLINDFQRDLPLTPAPFATIARELGVPEQTVLDELRRLEGHGVVSRVGPVFRPNAVGASTLAAMAVPAERLDAVAALVSASPNVNHNYERAHRFNLWFVATASDAPALRATLRRIETASGLPVLDLPLIEDYFIDLGFEIDFAEAGEDMRGAPRKPGRAAAPVAGKALAAPRRLDGLESALIAHIQGGLPLTSRPFARIGAALDMTERQVIATIERMVNDGVIKRMGVVVRHHELGYRANAMVVWDVPDEQVAALGRCIARCEAVRLCYRRPRRLPLWPYNLFCMIHGKSRETVLAELERIVAQCGMGGLQREVLFSVRRFKQCGARYRGIDTAVGELPAGAVPEPASCAETGRSRQ